MGEEHPILYVGFMFLWGAIVLALPLGLVMEKNLTWPTTLVGMLIVGTGIALSTLVWEWRSGYIGNSQRDSIKAEEGSQA